MYFDDNILSVHQKQIQEAAIVQKSQYIQYYIETFSLNYSIK